MLPGYATIIAAKSMTASRPAIPDTPLKTWAERCWRIGSRGRRWYYAAALILLVIAAALRFYELPAEPLWYDEAVAAHNVAGSFAEALANTRERNTSPILYPLLLYAIQKVDSSALSLRILPAAASLLTVAALLFLLPRCGFPRPAAFLAALLSTVSVAAVQHARDVREYSLDALLATLLIAGLLGHLHGSKKALLLLSAALFLAPLLQYGLALFSVAVLLTALLARRSGLDPITEPNPPPAAILNRLRPLWHWLRPRLWLTFPALCFAAGSWLSYWTTLQYQWQAGGQGADSYLAGYYYTGPWSDFPALLAFIRAQSWSLLDYHLTAIVATVFLIALAALLWSPYRNKRFPPVLLLLSFALLLVLAAALMQAYPYGGVRQSLHLGPALFLTAALAFTAAASQLAALAKREWLAPAALTVVAALIAIVGYNTLQEYRPYLVRENVDGLLAFLAKRVAPQDLVYVSAGAAPVLTYYQPERPPNYRYGDKVACTWDPPWECIQLVTDAVLTNPAPVNDLWLVSSHAAGPLAAEFQQWEGWFQVEVSYWQGSYQVYRLTESNPIRAKIAQTRARLQNLANTRRNQYRTLKTHEPTVAYTKYDLYLFGHDLIYLRDSCTPADLAERFILRVTPRYWRDLPEKERSKQRSNHNMDFYFQHFGGLIDGHCLAIVPLPGYAIRSIKTEQGIGGEKRFWSGRLDPNSPAVDTAAYRRDYQVATAGEPVARDIFDLYLTANHIIYIKEPCAPADTATRFILQLTPTRVADLPPENRPHGVDNLDFYFDRFGGRFDDKCIATVPLPGYAISIIRTGQGVPAAEPLWHTRFPHTW